LTQPSDRDLTPFSRGHTSLSESRSRRGGKCCQIKPTARAGMLSETKVANGVARSGGGRGGGGNALSMAKRALALRIVFDASASGFLEAYKQRAKNLARGLRRRGGLQQVESTVVDPQLERPSCGGRALPAPPAAAAHLPRVPRCLPSPRSALLITTLESL
jgi:hypothetical protein